MAVGAVVAVLAVAAACSQRPAAAGSSPPAASPAPAPAVAWAVGRGGLIEATADGQTWTTQQSGTTANLRDVAFADASHGWAVGAKGTILATSDGGANWTAQASGVRVTLPSVACVDRLHAWAAVDRRGSILATDDGGLHWRLKRLPAGAGWISSVACADRRHLWAASYDAVSASADGGRSWSVASLRRPSPLSRIVGKWKIVPYLTRVSCADARHVWVNGDGVGPRLWLGTSLSAFTLASADGGATWSRVNLRNPELLGGEVAALDRRHIWLWDTNELATSRNGGASWQAYSVTGGRRPKGQIWSIGDIVMRDARRGWMIGGWYQAYLLSPSPAEDGPSALLTTRDGGATWILQDEIDGSGMLSAVACAPPRAALP